MFRTIERAAEPGAKVIVFDLTLLGLPLRGIPDDLTAGGLDEGHIAIAPVDSEGIVDLESLQQWANTRGTGVAHALTMTLRKAWVENTRRPR